MKGVVVDVRATVAGERLRVGARVSTRDGTVDALLPDREVAAFLPRSLLLAGKGSAPRSLLASLTPILRRFTVGRDVRVWSYEEARYFSFPSWRSVRFGADDEGAAAARADCEPAKPDSAAPGAAASGPATQGPGQGPAGPGASTTPA
jgi:hypothetical protein